MEDDSKGAKAAKTSLKVIAALCALGLAVGLWFLAGAINNVGNKNAQDKIIAQKQESIAASKSPATKSPVRAPSTKDATTAPSVAASGTAIDHPQDGGDIPKDGADFGTKTVTAPDFGSEDKNAPYMNSWMDMPNLIGVTVDPMTNMSTCYETSKGYIICDLSQGYSIILDTYYGGIFGIASKSAPFTDDQIAMFRETFPEATTVPGLNTLSGSSVLLRGQINDLSEGE